MKLQGLAAAKGIAMGSAFVLHKQQIPVTDTKVADTTAEVAIFTKTKQTAAAQIAALEQKALESMGEAEAEIFNVHGMMLDDDDYNEMILNFIQEEQYNAAYAIDQTAQQFSAIFAAMDSEYMQARAADIIDISARMVNILHGADQTAALTSPQIVVAQDLYPSDTLALEPQNIIAFVTEQGSQNSHTAILARTLGVPSVVAVDGLMTQVQSGDILIVDGNTGDVLQHPDEASIASYTTQMQTEQQQAEALLAYLDKEAITKEGKRIEVCANIGGVADVASALEYNADGIGLFRSEFIYLNSPDFPTENAQFEIYKEVLRQMDGKRVIVRTLDLGADKQADYFKLPEEENPAMGYRAIRICLAQPEIFATQLRALLRASVYGKLAIMFPMMINESELLEAKALVTQLTAALKSEGHAVAEGIELGMMIETPAAAVMSDVLAPHVDFFSIGTNDLTQYTLAVDRMNAKISHLYSYKNPAVLRLMALTVENAHKHGTWVGICGESAGDASLTETYLAMGIDELACAPKSMLAVKAEIIGAL
ncbi:MAG: phosphoenolpyruvate--protein phosphotransferase [Faecalibacterium sp.]